MARPQVDWVCEVFKYQNSDCRGPNWLYIAKSPTGETLVKFFGFHGTSPWHKGQFFELSDNEAEVKFNARGDESKLRHLGVFKVQDAAAEIVWRGHDDRGREITMTLDRVMRLSPESIWIERI